MKVSGLVLGALSAAVVVKAADGEDSSSTHKYGRFDKTHASTTETSTGTHKDGRFNKTHQSSSETSSGTHKAGRFNKTHQSSSETSSGTHKAGRFNKTHPSSSETSTGTHKAGRFNKTHQSSSVKLQLVPIKLVDLIKPMLLLMSTKLPQLMVLVQFMVTVLVQLSLPVLPYCYRLTIFHTISFIPINY
ncbi:unnamed protein product [Wickerhamomyces anomalus]